MRSSDSPESDRAPGWEEEPASDEMMDDETLVKVMESPARLLDQDTDGDDEARRAR
jgi:hypothetical protein